MTSLILKTGKGGERGQCGGRPRRAGPSVSCSICYEEIELDLDLMGADVLCCWSLAELDLASPTGRPWNQHRTCSASVAMVSLMGGKLCHIVHCCGGGGLCSAEVPGWNWVYKFGVQLVILEERRSHVSGAFLGEHKEKNTWWAMAGKGLWRRECVLGF